MKYFRGSKDHAFSILRNEVVVVPMKAEAVKIMPEV